MNKTVLSVVLASTLLAPMGSMAQQPTRQRPAPEPIQLPAEPVSERSPAVNLGTVGKKVAPGVFEVDPKALQGKRLVVSPQDQAGAQRTIICLGKWDGKTCRGLIIIIE